MRVSLKPLATSNGASPMPRLEPLIRRASLALGLVLWASSAQAFVLSRLTPQGSVAHQAERALRASTRAQDASSRARAATWDSPGNDRPRLRAILSNTHAARTQRRAARRHERLEVLARRAMGSTRDPVVAERFDRVADHAGRAAAAHTRSALESRNVRREYGQTWERIDGNEFSVRRPHVNGRLETADHAAADGVQHARSALRESRAPLQGQPALHGFETD
jgi:hypothetical protein